jgi:hypothetical protein
MERVFPVDDPGILYARGNLTLAYVNAGRCHEAVSEFTRLLADYERVMGPGHILTLSVRGYLGKALLEVGRVAEGTELMKAATAEPAFIRPGIQEITPPPRGHRRGTRPSAVIDAMHSRERLPRATATRRVGDPCIYSAGDIFFVTTFRGLGIVPSSSA